MKYKAGLILLVAVAISIFLVSKDALMAPRCENALHFTVAPETFSSRGFLSSKDLRESAIYASEEWNRVMGKKLFEYLPFGSVLGRSGFVGIILFQPADLSELTINKPIAKTETAIDDNNIVSSFIIEVYSKEITNPYVVMLHELGHARGLQNHSDNQDDIMFKDYNPSLTELTERDIQAMKDYCAGL